MGRRQDLRGVAVQNAVVDLQRERDHAAVDDVAGLRRDLGVPEEDGHCDQTSDDHGVASFEDSSVCHACAHHRPKDAGDLDESIVSPRFVGAGCAELNAPTGQVVWEEDDEEWVSKANDEPGGPEESCRCRNLPGDEQGAEVDEELGHGESAARMGRGDGSTRIKLLDGKRKGPVVALG